MDKSTYDVTANHVISESEIRNKPSESDYKKVKKLFKDFGISEDIPKFNTKMELQRFSRTIIHNYLKSEDE
jgi:hypothetical protein